MLKKLIVGCVGALMTQGAYGEVGDSWSLSGDMQNVSNPGPTVNGGTWSYHMLPGQLYATAVSDPVIQCNPEVPDSGIGWVHAPENYVMLVKFSVDANPVPPWGTGDDKTNFLAGQVGGHSPTGATWETDHAGSFAIDYLGYNARDQRTAAPWEAGRSTYLVLNVAGVEMDRKVITGGVEDGYANAYTASVTIDLLPGDQVSLHHEAMSDHDWVGMDMMITEIPQGVSDVLDPAAAAFAIAVVPNPVRDATAIRYRGEAAGRARVAVYDASGRLVRALHDGPLPGGLITWQWDRRDASGRRVPSGVYLARMSAAGTEASRSVTVLR